MANTIDYRKILADKILMLTIDEKILIRQTWNYRLSDISERGVDIFVRLFELHPVYKSYFQKLRDVDIEDLRQSGKLRVHSTSVMKSITDLVETLDHPPDLRDMAIKIAHPHFDRGVRPSQYRELFAIILEYLKDKAKVDFNDEAEAAWQKLFDYVLDITAAVMDLQIEKMG